MTRTPIADMFAADIADWKQRSDELDRRMVARLARMQRLVDEMKRMNNAALSDLA